MSEPVIKAVRKARAAFDKTPRGRFLLLVGERRKWARRVTIAQNKLNAVNDQIAMMAFDATADVNRGGGK